MDGGSFEELFMFVCFLGFGEAVVIYCLISRYFIRFRESKVIKRRGG